MTAFHCATWDPEDETNRAMGWHSFFPCFIAFFLVLDATCFLVFCLPVGCVYFAFDMHNFYFASFQTKAAYCSITPRQI